MLLNFFIVIGLVVGYALTGYLVAKAGDALHKYLYGHAFLEDGGGWFLSICFWPLLLAAITIFYLALIPFKAFDYLNSKYGWCVVALEVDDDNKESTQDVINFSKTVGLPVGIGFMSYPHRYTTQFEQLINYLETTGWRKCLANDNKTVRYYSKVVRKREVVKL